MRYDHKKIEKKWQNVWEKERPWRADDASKKKKFYSLIEFPYPSGDGLHVGHIRSNTAMDIISRKRRMEGFNVLFPIGWDAFGLPTENYAIKTGMAPELVTEKNTENFRRQLKSLGFSFDWDREINTSDPEYYKWTQWIFLQFFRHGLAYKDTAYINWCVKCKIGLANEEAAEGVCERCGGAVEKRLKKQWMLRITSYADKLLAGLDGVDFIDRVKVQQRNWIGRSEGRLIEFKIQNLAYRQAGSKFKINVFTTRPDTIDGATFLVLAPEHPLVSDFLEDGSFKSKIKNKADIKKYVKRSLARTDLERQESREKTGVIVEGAMAVNPHNNEKIPIFISDYVLIRYGTGAIMAVPAYDERDREFAQKYNLPIKDAPLVAKKNWLGKKQVNYRLRDWVFSRQRYWGEPIPIIICERCGYVAVPEKDLPVKLPELKNYQPRDDGQSPLASAKAWLKVECPDCGGEARRETDTMPNWAGSSWYYWSYVINVDSPLNIDNKKFLKYWLPVDWYNGGMEHTTLHLLYSRFWNQFLHDIGYLPISEPYQKRTSHGFILGEGGIKMSKSRGNVVNPDELVKEFGADALRLYEMFLGPFDEAIIWDPRGIVGIERFLNRVYNLVEKADLDKKNDKNKRNADLEKLLHQTVKKVSEDIEAMRFNTAISALMILVNKMEEAAAVSVLPEDNLKVLIKLIFPLAPHLAQELWSQKFGDGLLDFENWPKWDDNLTKEDKFELIIQVNGKTRGTALVRIGISKKEAENLARSQQNIKKWLEGKKTSKVIFVPDRLINLIVS